MAFVDEALLHCFMIFASVWISPAGGLFGLSSAMHGVVRF